MSKVIGSDHDQNVWCEKLPKVVVKSVRAHDNLAEKAAAAPLSTAKGRCREAWASSPVSSSSVFHFTTAMYWASMASAAEPGGSVFQDGAHGQVENASTVVAFAVVGQSLKALMNCWSPAGVGTHRHFSRPAGAGQQTKASTGSCARRPVLANSRIDRLSRGPAVEVGIEGELAKLFPCKRIKIDRQHALSGAARRARGSGPGLLGRTGGIWLLDIGNARGLRGKEAGTLAHGLMLPFWHVRVWACPQRHIATCRAPLPPRCLALRLEPAVRLSITPRSSTV